MTDPLSSRGLTTAGLLAIAALGLPGCKPAAQQGTSVSEASPDTPPPSDLELAALESGAIVDARRLSPVGLYRNRHEAGTDALCVVPGADPSRMRFGMEAVFGENARCSGHGSVRRAGERLIFHFARSTCLIIAGYEGDRVVLPGALDVKCAQLCTERGSLEGVTFPRVSRDAGPALDARGRDGDPLCPST